MYEISHQQGEIFWMDMICFFASPWRSDLRMRFAPLIYHGTYLKQLFIHVGHQLMEFIFSFIRIDDAWFEIYN